MTITMIPALTDNCVWLIEEGVTIVMVTHDPQLAKLGNKRLEILDRKIIQRD